MRTFNVYVASYNRWEETTVYKELEYCTYVVRKSEAPYYEKLGVDLWAIDDELINSFTKLQNYIIENAPEDVVCVLDDDITNFYYRLEKAEKIKGPVQVSMELERMGQLIEDLDIGLMGSPIRNTPYGYVAEFHFAGMIGPIRIYNRHLITKSRYVPMQFFSDTDFALQEILNNRIILRPDYFVTDAKLETNKGGMNIRRTKQIQEECASEMRRKWGKYFSFDTNRNITMIMVKR